jgi:iron complex outermembrane receptor protein
LALPAAGAQAQTEPASAEATAGQIADLVVTARFREEKLQDTPLAITAESGEALAAKNINNVQDMGRIVPNAFITPGAAAVGATPAVSLRGVFQSDFNFAFEPGVGIYIDDVGSAARAAGHPVRQEYARRRDPSAIQGALG